MAKFRRNVERDERKRVELEARGWRVEIIWECETKNLEHLSLYLHNIFNLSEAKTAEVDCDAKGYYD